MKYVTSSIVALSLTAGVAFAAAHATPMVEASDQDVSNGIVSADKVVAGENGWLVVHRTDADMKPGPVVGYAPCAVARTWMSQRSFRKRSHRATC